MNWTNVGRGLMVAGFGYMVFALVGIISLPLSLLLNMTLKTPYLLIGTLLGLLISEKFNRGGIIKDLKKEKWI